MRDLTKWPRLLVTGDPVTREQANEILVRTDSWWLTGNDRAWEQQLYDALGINYTIDQGRSPQVEFADLDRFTQEVDRLDLHYLQNSRIYSSWIGGPHGWCDWEGNIGCSTWNIGKWPDVDSVDEDWRDIAHAFPYLKLRAQLVPNEGEDTQPACEWVVENGEAHLVEPVGLLRPVEEQGIDFAGLMYMNSGRERGVSIRRLIAAVQQVRQTMKERTR